MTKIPYLNKYGDNALTLYIHLSRIAYVIYRFSTRTVTVSLIHDNIYTDLSHPVANTEWLCLRKKTSSRDFNAENGEWYLMEQM